jgi:hypothetical protein
VKYARLVLFLAIIVVLILVGLHPRVSSSEAAKNIQATSFWDVMVSEGHISLPKLVRPAVVSGLGFLDALNNLLFLFLLALLSLIAIPIVFVGAIISAIGGVIANSGGNFFLGCLLAVISPLLMLAPLVSWMLLLFQPNGSVAYYLTMAIVALPIIIGGWASSFVGLQPVLVVVFRQ